MLYIYFKYETMNKRKLNRFFLVEILVSFLFCKFVNRVLDLVHELPEKELDQYFHQKEPDLTFASITFIYIVLGGVAKRRKFRGCYVEQYQSSSQNQT